MVLSCVPAMALADTLSAGDKNVEANVTESSSTTSAAYTIKFVDEEGAKAANDIPGTITWEESATQASFSFTLPAANAKDGFTFKNWTNGTTDFAEEEPVKVTVAVAKNVEITFTAVYEEDAATGFTITLDANGGTLSGEATLTTVDGKATLPTPTRTGYTFKGWAEKATPTVVKYTAEAVAAGEITFDADAELVAVWEEVPAGEFTITLDANGGTVSSTSLTTSGGKATLPTPTQNGYTFKGWAEKATPTTVKYQAGEQTFTANAELVAVWEKEAEPTVKVVVKFNANGGTGTMAQQEETLTSGGSFKLKGNEFTREGYKFTGWAEDPEEAVAFEDGETIPAPSSDTELNLYAVWEELPAGALNVEVVISEEETVKSFTVADGAAGVELTYAQIMEYLGMDGAPTKEGYAFLGWSNEALLTAEANLVKPDSTNAIALTKDSNIIYAQWTATVEAPAADKIQGEEAQKAVNDIVTEVNSGESILSDVQATVDVNKSMNNAIDKKLYERFGEKVTITLDISIKEAKSQGESVEVTFDITPKVNGETIDNGYITQQIDFYLPVPPALRKTNDYTLNWLWAKVFHNSDNTRETKKAYYDKKNSVKFGLSKFSEATLGKAAESYKVNVHSEKANYTLENFDLPIVDGNYTTLLNAVKADSKFRVSKMAIDEIVIPAEYKGEAENTINVDKDGVTFEVVYKDAGSGSDDDSSSGSSGGGGGGGSTGAGSPPVVSVKDADGKNMSTKCVTYSASDKTATIKAPAGYEIADVKLNGKSLGVVTKIEDVTKKDKIEVVLKVADATTTTEPTTPSTEPTTPSASAFVDVNGHWAASYITRAVELGLFSGTSTTTFSPDAKMTRGMIAAVLYRMSGETFNGMASFSDVAANAYYNNAVAWGADKGIIAGIGNGMFAPDTEITREQMAVLIYNYAKYAGLDTATATLNFTDNGSISSWASEAVAYCVNAGIISGRTDGSFDPQGTATRAEVASILVRFIDK